MSDRTVPTPPHGIDPRGPRFAAGITSLLLLVAVFLSLIGQQTAQATLAERVADPAFLLLLAIALLFLWGVLSPRTVSDSSSSVSAWSSTCSACRGP